MQYTLNYYC